MAPLSRFTTQWLWLPILLLHGLLGALYFSNSTMPAGYRLFELSLPFTMAFFGSGLLTALAAVFISPRQPYLSRVAWLFPVLMLAATVALAVYLLAGAAQAA